MTYDSRLPRTSLQGYFAAISARLRLQVDVMTPVIVHSGEMGDNDHLWFADLLRQYLPTRIGVETGFVVNAHSDAASEEHFAGGARRTEDESIGPQSDILLVDLAENAPLCSEKSFRVYPVEMVLGVVEITRSLGTAKFSDDLAKIARVRQLARERYYYDECIEGWPKPYGYVVGLKSDLSMKSIRERINDVPEDLRPAGVLILDQEEHGGDILLVHSVTGRFLRIRDDALFHFISLVRNQIESFPVGRTNLRAYIPITGSIHWGEGLESSSAACEDDIIQYWEETGIATDDTDSHHEASE